MLSRSRRRDGRAGYTGRTWLIRGDAHRPPLAAGVFDAVFMSLVLELTDTPQIPVVLLDECHRVLGPGGRLGVVSLQLTWPPALIARLYLAARGTCQRPHICRGTPRTRRTRPEGLFRPGYGPGGSWPGRST
jgi:ubiquinone/menaquinone biosynthesis C-methylase UbiE